MEGLAPLFVEEVWKGVGKEGHASESAGKEKGDTDSCPSPLPPSLFFPLLRSQPDDA